MFNIKQKQEGVSLFLAIMILSVLMAGLLALTNISISQIKVMQNVGDSVIVFYAADTGIERMLYALYKEGYTPAIGCPYSDNWSVGGHIAEYQVCVTGLSPLKIYSSGTYKNTRKRNIEINF